MIKWMSKLFHTKTKIKQNTFCYCPECHHEMIGDKHSFIEDHELVKFKCAQCGNRSEWNFDLAPVALVVRSDNEYKDI